MHEAYIFEHAEFSLARWGRCRFLWWQRHNLYNWSTTCKWGFLQRRACSLYFKRSTECSKEGLWKPYFKIRLNQCTIFANNFSYDFILLTKRGRLFLIKIKSLVATQTCIWLLRVYRCRGVDAFQNTARHHHLECSLSLSFKWIQDFSVSIYNNYSTILINIQFALLVLPTISTAFGWLKGLRKATHHIL